MAAGVQMVGITVLVIAGVLVTMGIVLIEWRIWTSRRGSTPYCKTCGYNLTGSPADRCSECGKVLTQAQIVYGERLRRPVTISCGILLILVTSIPLFIAARRVNWYQLRPTAWVIGDFQTSAAAGQKQAWAELTRRFEAGTLSENQQNQFIRLCLAEQAAKPTSSPFTAEAFFYLKDLYMRGDLTPTQAKQFFENMVLTCNVDVTPGQDGVGRYNKELVIRSLSEPMETAFWFRIREAIDVDPAKPASWDRWDTATINAYRWQRSTNGLSLEAEPGNHTLRYLVEVEVYEGSEGDLDTSRLCHRFRAEDREAFLVTPGGRFKIAKSR